MIIVFLEVDDMAEGLKSGKGKNPRRNLYERAMTKGEYF
jgi:hypothetical protein